MHARCLWARSVELPRYSDKYRPSPASQPTLKRKDLHQPFFPQEIFESFFNPKKRKTSMLALRSASAFSDSCIITPADKKGLKKRINLDDMIDDAEEQV